MLTKIFSQSKITLSVLMLAIACTTGCASSAKRNQPVTAPAYDPLEKVNRKIFAFNEAADKYVLAPVARGYRAVLPDPVETGIGNFFSNLGEVSVVVNDLLQGKFVAAGRDSVRFLLNSTGGLLGFVAVSYTHLRAHETRGNLVCRLLLEKTNESWGQTFGVWGIGEGPYLVLPLIGPANARSFVGQLTNSALTDPIQYIDHTRTRLSFSITEVISIRAELLSAGQVFDAAALDPYSFLRASFTTRHRSRVRDLDKASRGDEESSADELDELDLLDEEQPDELDELDLLDEEDELDSEN